METKKLYRSNTNRVFAGVCGGIGEYFNIDPIIVRIIWVVVTFLGGAGVLAYVIAWIIIPEQGEVYDGRKAKGCLYAVLIVMAVLVLLSLVGSILGFIISAPFNLIFGSAGGGMALTGIGMALTFIGGLVTIGIIILIILIIKRASKKD